MRVLFKKFRGTLKSWDTLFQEATDFATELQPDRLVSISHSADKSDGIVTVWYRGDPQACTKCEYNLTGLSSDRCPECGTRT